MELGTILVFLVSVLVGAYFYIKNKHTYWIKKGIAGPKPQFFFGNAFDPIKNGLAATELQWMKNYGQMYGIYIGLTPALTITEPDLIKQVMIRDLPTVFMNRRKQKFEHEIWSKNLFHSEGDLWKKIRSITSVAFTSAKMRNMSGLMNQCVDRLILYFDKLVESENSVVNIKEVLAGYTIDVIGTTSFAVQTNANDDRSKRNAFVDNGLGLFKTNPLKVLSMLIMPKCFNNFFNLRIVFPEKNFNFFRDLAKTVIRKRREENKNQTKRNDLVQLLVDSYVYESDLKEENENRAYEKLAASMEVEDSAKETHATNSRKKTLTENECIAQCLGFFVGGFETTATTMTHIIYELAVNQDIQERLREEIEFALEGLTVDDEKYYETVTGKDSLPYLDSCIKETLRKYPPLTRIERRVGVDGYHLTPTLTLEKDTVVQVSTYALHHNPQYWPDPQRFDPDRFSAERRHTIQPYTYLPFGSGSRNCIGMRFAYQEIKLCLTKILPRFKFTATPETPVPIQFAKNSLILTVNSLPIRVERR